MPMFGSTKSDLHISGRHRMGVSRPSVGMRGGRGERFRHEIENYQTEIGMISKRGGARPGAGRPKGSRSVATVEQGATLAELARKHAPTAIRTLAQIARKGESESARVAAANALLDRGFGRPTQSHEHSGPNGGPIEYANLSDEEISARIAAHEAARGKRPTAH
ncbi:hypothetical protein ACFSTI_20755 [Rhizorhabdus histidinilytica]